MSSKEHFARCVLNCINLHSAAVGGGYNPVVGDDGAAAADSDFDDEGPRVPLRLVPAHDSLGVCI